MAIIDGFSIAGFRSLGLQEQRLDELSRMNFVVGKNNAGKSNILRVITTYLNLQGAGDRKNDAALDKPLLGDAKRVEVGFKVRSQGEDVTALIERRLHARGEPRGLIEQMRNRLFNDGFDPWLYYVGKHGGTGISIDDQSELARQSLRASIRYPAFAMEFLCGIHGGDIDRQITAIGKALDFTVNRKLKCDLIPAVRSVFRQIPSQTKLDPSGQLIDEYGLRDFGGAGLIQKLEQLDRPTFDRLVDREKFERIKQLMRSVLEDDSFNFYISHDTAQIIVELGGRSLPLQSLGTGIDQLFLIAATCTLLENQVVCIEEIENHLHPTLQRQLVRNLELQTKNQYFISTHSSHILDAAVGSVYEVRADAAGHSTIKAVLTGSDRHSAIRDLGYKPSDIVQANSIVWVEGPSDKIYVLGWLAAAATELVEGTHFSIMFYGGSLLSHLSADDEVVNELIRLSRLNQKVALIMDSDKTSSAAPLNSTKLRVLAELEKSGNFGWATAGRTIENYLSKEHYEETLEQIYGAEAESSFNNRWTKLTEYGVPKNGMRPIDKVKFSRTAMLRTPTLDVFDLNDRVQNLATFIRNAN